MGCACETKETEVKPDLVCKIVVRTASGEQYRGSGYPITPNRIITAAHVVADAGDKEEAALEGTARDITLAFGTQAKPLDTPVFIEWCDTEVDIAVLRCQLPAALQPAHQLLTTPPQTPVKWEAQGYTEFGKAKRQGGQDKYNGTLLTFSAKEATVPLGCDQGLITSAQWEGGSGSVAFDQEPARTALAVITKYQSGKTHDLLIAIPLCYLLNSDKTGDGFRRAIQFDAYQRRAEYRNDVIHTVASKLNALRPEALQRLAQEINALTTRGNTGINLKLTPEALADEAAAYIVSHTAVTDVVGCLVGLMQDLGPEISDKVADIIDHVLPLNYAPGVIHRLYEHIAADQFGLVDNEVATRTLAEIIMAGYDQKPAKFAAFADGSTDIRGQTALDYCDEPEEGPGHAESEGSRELRAVCNLLYDLLALQDTLWGAPYHPLHRKTPSAQSEVELHRMIQDAAIRLRGALTGVSKSHRGRTVYCVLPLPPEGTPQRDFRKRVIGVVHHHVPLLIFVELMQTPTDEREFEVGAYIKARVIRARQMRKP